MDMRRRRAHRSEEPVPAIDDPSLLHSAHVNNLVPLYITTLIGLYYDFVDFLNRMAFGLPRWLGARSGASEHVEEEVKLLDRPSGKKKVKRRRRKEETPGQRSFVNWLLRGLYGRRCDAVLSWNGQPQRCALLYEFSFTGMW